MRKCGSIQTEYSSITWSAGVATLDSWDEGNKLISLSVHGEILSLKPLDFHELSKSVFLRLQKGCVPDQVPLGKHILSEEPIRSKPSEQLK